MIIHTVEVKEGSLEVAKRHDLSVNLFLGYFWFDFRLFPQKTQGFGPFESLHQAVEHYSISVEHLRANNREAFTPKLVLTNDPLNLAGTTVAKQDNRPDCQVIHVDFVNRQRTVQLKQG